MPLFQTANFPAPEVTVGGTAAGSTAAGSWALWQIEESEPQLLRQLDSTRFPLDELEGIRLPQRRLEWLACRLALQNLLGDLPGARLHKNEWGRPYLSSCAWHISLSHSFPYAAAAVHRLHPVGIDVEKPRAKLLRIRHKFLSEQEQAWVGEDLQQLCLWWAAKEALYKLNGQPGLLFAQDMYIGPTGESSILRASLHGKFYALHYQWYNDLLLCVVV